MEKEINTEMEVRQIAIKVPENKLKDYAHYLGYVFKNRRGIYSICNTVEEIENTNKWHNFNIPLRIFKIGVVESFVAGDKIIAECVNQDLDMKIFTYLGMHSEGTDL